MKGQWTPWGTGLEAKEASGERRGLRTWRREAGVLRSILLERHHLLCVPHTPPTQLREDSTQPGMEKTRKLLVKLTCGMWDAVAPSLLAGMKEAGSANILNTVQESKRKGKC